MDGCLNVVQQVQNQDDHQDRPQYAARIISPAATVGVYGRTSKSRNQQNDEQNENHGV